MIRDETHFILSHPDSGLTKQQSRLLEFLLTHAAGFGRDDPSQQDISAAVLGVVSEFDQDIDARVRVAMLRLRRALEEFYARAEHKGRRQIFIPKGQYRLKQIVIDRPSGSSGHDSPPTPAAAWTVHAMASPRCEEFGHSLERELARLLLQAPLVHDGTMDVVHLRSTKRSEALDRARHRGAGVLGVLCIERAGADLVGRIEMMCCRTRKAFWVHEERLGANPADPRHLAERFAVSLTDPLMSPVPDRLARCLPGSRLEVAMRFFRFMATQDRRLLPEALDSLQYTAGTSLASPLTDALRIDAVRANFCFATSCMETLPVHLVDEAARIYERAPFQPYASLAWGYVEMAAGGTVCLANDYVETFGSHALDADLLGALSGAALRTRPSGPPETKPPFFFERAAGIVSAMMAEEFTEAETLAFSGNPGTNIWMRLFQATISHELNKNDRARMVFAKMCQENPGANEYLHRAITTMIPNEAVHGRIVHAVSQLG